MPSHTGRRRRTKISKADQIARRLGWFSIGIGVAQVLAPRTVSNLMGVGLVFAHGPPPDEWRGAFADNVGHAIAEDEHVRLAEAGWEPYTVGELRAAMRHAGKAGFVDGLAEWVSDPAGPNPKSPFTVLCRSTG